MKHLTQLPAFIKFIMVGILATILHYGIYFLLQYFINVNVAYTTGYLLSFLANFYLTSYFTFGQKPSLRRALGFGGAHFCNYLIHITLLNLFLMLGVDKAWAPLPVFAIAIPTNFLMVKFVFRTPKSYKRND